MDLTPGGEEAVQNLAQRYRLSVGAVKALLSAVNAGGGAMAQFYIPELGGGGQWMRGGMTMVGDMFNHGLQATVSGLCSELSALLGSQQVFAPLPSPQGFNGFAAHGNSWWPAELGAPSSSGGQNNSRYAYFPQARRLAIDSGGQVTVYDTLDHQIGGVQQQQGNAYGLSFSSQFGTFTVESLPRAAGEPQSPARDASPPAWQSSAPAPTPAPPMTQPTPAPSSGALHSHQDILAALEGLAQLHQRGILSDDEFKSKKAELLARF
jgi:hypothetical protein